MKHLPCLGLAALALLPLAVRADEKDEALAKQKATAEANWKKMEFKEAPALVETANLLVYSRLPEAKTKVLAAALEKIYTTALKPLKYDAKEPPWPGKLAVYILPERGEFVQFMRAATRKSPGEDDVGYGNVSGDIAMVVAGAPRSGDSEPEERARFELTTLLLRRKLSGADPPEWLAAGFAKATTSRIARPTSKAVTTPPAASFAALWSEDIPSANKVKLATFLVDYLAYGPAELFSDFVGALRPGENGGTPSAKDVAEAIKLDVPSLDLLARAWKKPPTAKPPAVKPKDKPKDK